MNNILCGLGPLCSHCHLPARFLRLVFGEDMRIKKLSALSRAVCVFMHFMNKNHSELKLTKWSLCVKAAFFENPIC